MFAAARTLVSPKHTAVDQDLTVPSVLTLVQHFLKDTGGGLKVIGRDGFRGETRSATRAKTSGGLKPVQMGCLWPREDGGEGERGQERGFSGKLHSFPGGCFSGFI